MGGDINSHRDDSSSSSSTHSWQEKAARAKRKHRPTLKNWEADGLADSFPSYANAILESKHPYRSFRLVEKYDVDEESGDDGSGERKQGRRERHKRVIVEERRQSLECARRRRRHHKRTPRQSVTDADADEEEASFHDNTVDEEEQQVKYPIVLHASHTPPSIFHEFYEAKCIPVVIRDIPLGYHHHHQNPPKEEKDNDYNYKNDHQYHPIPNVVAPSEASSTATSTTAATDVQNEWPAIHRWTLPSLSHDATLLDRPFKVGEDDDGHAVRMKLRHFLRYMQCNKDDSPLYVFDATFDEDQRGASRLLEDYAVPAYFDEDLMSLVGERRRPPHRWFLVGPRRSGTAVHVDPLGTSAWNTLIVGVKRWVLFPPHVPKSIVKGTKLILPGEDDEAIHYFTTILPRMKRRAAAMANNNCRSGGGGANGEGDGNRGGRSKDLGGYANFECYEFTQYPGETVFIPHGFWHAVLNLTDTVGITQNYCSRRNFDAVWSQARSGRKKMSCSWLRKLDAVYPDLAYRARELNLRDGYVMLEEDSPAERAQRREKKRAERRERKKEKERSRKLEEGGMKSKRREQQQLNQKQARGVGGEWGDHRIAERRRRNDDVDGEADDGEGNAIMREVSPD